MSQNHNPEELGQYLDELFRSSDLPTPDTIDDPQIEVALQLAHDTPPQLSDAMRARMRAKVQQAHQAKYTPKPRRQLAFPAQQALRWAAVFAVFIIIMSSVTVPAAAASLPGEFLYPVKRIIETIEIELAETDDALANTYISHASRRLDEAHKLPAASIIEEQLITEVILNLKQASQIAPDKTNIQPQLDELTDQTSKLIEQVAEVDEIRSEVLSVQLSTINPPIVIDDNSTQPEATVEEDPLPTETSAPTLTHTPTSTLTPTETVTATATDTDIPTEEAVIQASSQDVYEPYVGVVSATALVNIRNLPSTDSEINLQVTPGTVITVVGETIDGMWLQISLDDGTQGWIAANLITEGTVPEFTVPTATVEAPVISPEVAVPASSDVQQSFDTSTNNGNNSSTNQGNDGINKFGCDGRGNSCNNGNDNGNNGNNGNGNGNSGNGNNGNGNGNSGNNGNGNSGNGNNGNKN